GWRSRSQRRRTPAPVTKAPLRGEDDRALLVALADDLRRRWAAYRRRPRRGRRRSNGKGCATDPDSGPATARVGAASARGGAATRLCNASVASCSSWPSCVCRHHPLGSATLAVFTGWQARGSVLGGCPRLAQGPPSTAGHPTTICHRRSVAPNSTESRQSAAPVQSGGGTLRADS